ncbi:MULTISPECIES: XTP/dITP diphosphatase [Bacillaceae]|uniref:dITP/XTP pyrophosphatase n=1 Tax=Alkalicoccobacillus plakortidis TaxID=444060 RepID=A0A9D5DUS7_9BACI|nr:MULTISPECIES: XTP/dITP diphosphatase [Bacillaceae]KQL57557.1 non-canonical purine NTP pyrophosphatase [Alkalicoccobacillus plakortidis]
MKELLIATANKGKVEDFKKLFQGMYEVKSLLDYPHIPDIIEDGQTFQDNAQKKAEVLSKALNETVVADDSGLVIDALNGRPGVFSARYAGEEKNDQANIKKVLEDLRGVAEQDRTARFVCTIALASPDKKTIFFEGQCEGCISHEQIGENGFGYDPIFYVGQTTKTMAQLTLEEKNEISHRARAIEQLNNYLIGE